MINIIYSLCNPLPVFFACANTAGRNISWKRRGVVYLYVLALLSLLYPWIGQYVTPIALIGVSVILTWRLEYKIQNLTCFFAGYMTVVCIDYLFTISSHSLFNLSIADWQEDSYLLVLLVTLTLDFLATWFIGYVLHKKLKIQELGNSNRLLFGIMVNLGLCTAIYVFGIAYGYHLKYPPSVVLADGILFFLYFIVSNALLILTCRTIRKDYALENRSVQYEALKSYTAEIEQMYHQMRAFKHDYLDILASMKEYVDHSGEEEMKKYFYHTILPLSKTMADSDNRLGLLSNVKNDALKGLLSAKLLAAMESGLHIQLDVRGTVDKIVMKPLDLIRIIGILLNNATDAAGKSPEKELHLALMDTADKTLILLDNSALPLEKPIEVLLQAGQTTKQGAHSGLGLYTAQTILNSYTNIQWKVKYEEPYFKFAIEIAKNGGKSYD